MNRHEYQIRATSYAFRGENCPASKMTEAQVLEARELYARAQFSVQYIQTHYFSQGLADKYGISKSGMEKILRGETWSHV